MLSQMVRGRSTSVLLIFVAAGFALLLGELLMIGHINQIQMVGVVSSAVGLILSLLGFIPRVGLRRIVIGLFVVLALVGLFGVFIHMGGRARRQAQMASVQMPEDRLMRRALTSFRRNPPLVPPLALSGLSGLGIVALLGAGAAAETQVRRQGLAAVPE